LCSLAVRRATRINNPRVGQVRFARCVRCPRLFRAWRTRPHTIVRPMKLLHTGNSEGVISRYLRIHGTASVDAIFTGLTSALWTPKPESLHAALMASSAPSRGRAAAHPCAGRRRLQTLVGVSCEFALCTVRTPTTTKTPPRIVDTATGSPRSATAATSVTKGSR